MCSKPTNVFLFKRLVSPVQICCRSIKGGGLVHPVTGKEPPTLEEFDPLNPGEWQLGAYGKILPRLPEGTRCGGLVMGKYGLYNPKVRALQEECYPKMMAGVPTERVNRNQEITFQMCKWMVILSVFFTAHNFAMMLYGTKEKPLWPYTLFMKKSDGA